MAVLTDPIVFNNSTGSDTTASGSGSVSLNGTGASTNNTTAVDVSADGVDTSGVTAGDLLWVDSSSGRQFSVIASVDSGTDIITCDDTFTQTEGSRNWGIGGKRSTLEGSDQLWSDLIDNQCIEIEYTGTDYTITSKKTFPVNNVTVKGTGSARPTISGNHNDVHFAVRTRPVLVGLRCVTTNVTNTLTGMLENKLINNSLITVVNCVAESMEYVVNNTKTNTGVSIDCCGFYDIGSHVLKRSAGNFSNSFNSITNSFVLSCAGLISLGASSTATVQRVHANVIAGCSDSVFDGADFDGLEFSDNIVYDVTGDVIEALTATKLTMKRNVFDTVSGDVVDDTANGSYEQSAGLRDNNFYRSITGSKYTSGFTEENETDLTADPFVDAASDDFNFNDTAGGGAVLRADSHEFPFATGTDFFPFRDMVSDSFGGAGGGLLRVGMNGGMNG